MVYFLFFEKKNIFRPMTSSNVSKIGHFQNFSYYFRRVTMEFNDFWYSWVSGREEANGVIGFCRCRQMDCDHFLYTGVSGREESNGVIGFRR